MCVEFQTEGRDFTALLCRNLCNSMKVALKSIAAIRGRCTLIFLTIKYDIKSGTILLW